MVTCDFSLPWSYFSTFLKIKFTIALYFFLLNWNSNCEEVPVGTSTVWWLSKTRWGERSEEKGQRRVRYDNYLHINHLRTQEQCSNSNQNFITMVKDELDYPNLQFCSIIPALSVGTSHPPPSVSINPKCLDAISTPIPAVYDFGVGTNERYTVW